MKTHATSPGARRDPARDFRHRLQAELARRCADNPSYSLRAFALDLATDHATLGQLLRGARPLTERTIRLLGARLGLSPAELDACVAAEHLRRAEPAEAAGAAELDGATLALVGTWPHLAILELTRLTRFRPESRWIAAALGLATDEVNLALQRLIRLGLLEMTAADRWTDLAGATHTPLEELPAAARERLGVELRRRALAAVAAAPPGRRVHASSTLAIARDRLPEALARIARFRAELARLLAEGEADDVYQLEVSLFPLTSLPPE